MKNDLELKAQDSKSQMHAKCGLGKAIYSASEIFFTMGTGIVDSFYYPREDNILARDLECIVIDDQGFYSEERTDATHDVKPLDHAPAFFVTSHCIKNKYKIEKQICCDPFRNTLLQKIKFIPLEKGNFRLFLSLTPEKEMRSFLGQDKKLKMILAEKDGYTLSLAAEPGLKERAIEDCQGAEAREELKKNHLLSGKFDQMTSKEMRFLVELDLSKENEVVIAVGSGRNFFEAANNVHASLLDCFEETLKHYIHDWNQWTDQFKKFEHAGRFLRESVVVLRLNESKKFPGAIIASPSVPWGFAKKIGVKGYHYVWPRDLVESATAFLALDNPVDTLRILNYLMSVQEKDGSWSQNYQIDGEKHWKVIQMDQIALPILLLGECLEQKILDQPQMETYWPLLKNAAQFLINKGPYTQQGRWEGHSGYSPYSLATQIAALLVTARVADQFQEYALSQLCREKADLWNGQIEELCYVTDTEVSRELGVEGYYILSNPTNEPINLHKDQLTKIPAI